MESGVFSVEILNGQALVSSIFFVVAVRSRESLAKFWAGAQKILAGGLQSCVELREPVYGSFSKLSVANGD